MERIKRQRIEIVHNDYGYKKIKLQTGIPDNSNQSSLENLANETLYEIFEYLDIYHVYQGFFDLNARFKTLLLYSNIPIQINVSTMSKSNFQYYHQTIIVPNKHRINYLRLSNPFTVDIVFSPPRMISKLIRLQRLILDHIKAKYLENIFIHLTRLPELYSLTIHPCDRIRNAPLFYSQIFRLPKLKYCQIQFVNEDNLDFLSRSVDQASSIEHLVIKTHFPLYSFKNLLSYLPRLRRLSIDCLAESYVQDDDLYSPEVQDLKYVSLKLDLVSFNQWEKLVQHVFRPIEVLHLTTKCDPAYLDAKRWEQLILSSMPNLRLFDLNHDCLVRNHPFTYHDLVNQFNSSFWIEKQWFFAHQHDWQERLDCGIVYSTNPYRRKDYTFYWQSPEQICSSTREKDLSSAHHVSIDGKQAITREVIYFPNATELTIKRYFDTSDNSISTTLNRMLPLVRLTKLVIECYHFPFEQLIELLPFTPNLQILKYNIIFFHESNLIAIQNTDLFQRVLHTNTIKYFELQERCTYEQFEMIVNLFPHLQCLKSGMPRVEMEQIIRLLFSKTKNKTCRLFFLCITQIRKICLRQLNTLIQTENLVNDYLIKLVNRDLYLWW